MAFTPQDHYFHRAKKEWYLARSVYKLEEINNKFKLFDNHTRTVLDVWCAPWSWMQYTDRLLAKTQKWKHRVFGLDIQNIEYQSETCLPAMIDATDREAVRAYLSFHNVETVDCIISDMAPNTIWHKWSDAIRSIWLIEKTLRLYETILKPWWGFAIKVFMWPWFEELYHDLRTEYGWPRKVKIFKPKACRKDSKETYIVRIPDTQE